MPHKSNKRKRVRRTTPEDLFLSELVEKIRNDEMITPGDLANHRLRLAAEYSNRSEKLREILKRKPEIWIEIYQRDDVSSGKHADKLWESTELGKDEMSLRLLLKEIDKLMSSINTRLRTYQDESRHNY